MGGGDPGSLERESALLAMLVQVGGWLGVPGGYLQWIVAVSGGCLVVTAVSSTHTWCECFKALIITLTSWQQPQGNHRLGALNNLPHCAGMCGDGVDGIHALCVFVCPCRWMVITLHHPAYMLQPYNVLKPTRL
jgi:hypothetical protein